MSGQQGRSSASTGHPGGVRPPTPSHARLQGGSARLAYGLRLPVFVAVATGLGVAAHTVAERALPHPALLVLAAAAVTACSLVLRSGERSFEAVAGTLLAAQVAVHAVLGLDHCAPGTALGSLGGGMSAPGYLAHLYPGHAMLLAHLLAAGVTAWWLRHGEAAVWAAAGWVWPAPPVAAVSVPAAAPGPARAPEHGCPVRRDQVAGTRRTPRRGPPALAARAVLIG